MNELEELRKLYMEELRSEVVYNGVKRTRVRHPGKWEALPTQIALTESAGKPIELPLLDNDRNIWVWSDLHFFHKNIIEFSNRPFTTTAEMNEHLVANFNEYVGPNDVSIWVGDIGFKGTGFINELLDKCNGYKILVVGNHDFDGKHLRKLKFDETHLIYKIDLPEGGLVFTHYPMNNIKLPWFNVHGHLHAYPNPYTGNPLHYNICCELHDYKPVNLKDIIRIANARLISEGV